MKREIAAVAVAVSMGMPASAQLAYETWFPGGSSIAEPEIIPPAYRGSWAPNEAECNDEHGVSRMTVFWNGVETYESGGRLERVTQSGQDRSIRMKLSYEGEGEFWDAIETWTLDAMGNRLTISGIDRGPEILIRCEMPIAS